MSETTVTRPDQEQRNAHDEFTFLMSLALDDGLEAAERHKLMRHLSECEPCGRQWHLWRCIDRQFHAAPLVTAPADFVQRVEARIAVMENRHRLQVGILLALLTLLIWTSGVAGVSLAIGLLIYNQGDWLAETLDGIVAMVRASSIVVDLLWDTLLSFGSNPSAIAAGLCYTGLAVVTLAIWMHFLRRSTQPLDSRSA